MKRTFLMVWSVWLVFLLLGTGCGRHGSPKPSAAGLPATPVRVLRLEAREFDSFEETLATVEARRVTKLEGKLPGRIVELRAAAGQEVRRGEQLVRLEASEARARLEQARAADEQARADLKRISFLLERQAATRSEFDATQARARSTAAVVQELVSLLEHSDIIAPFDGVIRAKWVEVGDLAVPGKLLLELEDPSSLRIEVHVAESLIPRLKLGDALGVRSAALDRSVRGVVSEIAPAAHPGSRTVAVKLDLPPGSGLRSGTAARVDLPLGQVRALRVPSSSLVQRGQMEFVFIAADGRAQLRLVKSGRRLDNETELLAGAESGELLVVSGISELRDGQPIVVQP